MQLKHQLKVHTGNGKCSSQSQTYIPESPLPDTDRSGSWKMSCLPGGTHPKWIPPHVPAKMHTSPSESEPAVFLSEAVRK